MGGELAVRWQEVYRTLMLACQNLVKRYPTTLQQDAELLAKDDLSSNMRNAIHLRKGEKETLILTMNYIARSHTHALATIAYLFVVSVSFLYCFRLWDDFLVRGYDGDN